MTERHLLGVSRFRHDAGRVFWDVHYEVKCWNPLIKSTTLGRGSWGNGGNVASVGHLYGFGNTLDKALTAVVGCKERGRQVDGPLDHSTGKGWVKDHAYGDGWVKKNAGWKWTGAQYYDAKWVKKAITRLVLVETLGGIAPPTNACWGQLRGSIPEAR